MEFTKTKSKTRSKNRLFICFKRTVIDCDSSTDPVLANFAVGEKESSVVLPRMFSSVSAPEVMANCGEEESGRPWRKNRYWLVLKTALKETSLGKKIRRRKAAKDKSFHLSSINNSSRESDQNSNSLYKPTNSRSASSSSFCPSAFASSSLHSPSSSSLSSHTFSSSSSFEMKRINAIEFNKRRQQRIDSVKESRNECHDSKMQLCWFLVSLLVLILWGKVCSILCTCVWLYLVPRRSLRGGPPARHAIDEREFDSVRYKKAA